MNQKEQLLEIVKKHYSDTSVTLSSGKSSNFYIDGKMVTLSAEGSYLIANILKPWLIEDEITAIGGLMIGSDPIAAAVSTLSYNWEQKISAFIVRKEQKQHGMQKTIEGPLTADDTVAMVDDIITSGKSVLQAVEKVEKIGAKIKTIYALVDRLEGGKKNIEAKGYFFKPIFTINDLKS